MWCWLWSMSLILKVIRFWVLPESVCSWRIDSFFPEIHVTFIDCVGDQPDLKLGGHFERVALGIKTATSCVLVRGARDGFAAVALKPSPCLGHCLGEKTSPSTPSLWPAWRSFACTAALEGKHGGYQGYGRWRLDPFREASPGAWELHGTCL